MTKTNLGSVLRHARASQGLTLLGIQKMSRGKITGTLVGTIESGKHSRPKPETLRVLAKILKLNFIGLMILSGNLTSDDVDMIVRDHLTKKIVKRVKR